MSDEVDVGFELWWAERAEEVPITFETRFGPVIGGQLRELLREMARSAYFTGLLHAAKDIHRAFGKAVGQAMERVDGTGRKEDTTP